MNFIAIIILIAIVVEYIFNIILDMLNLTVLQDELPETFKGMYDPERYRTSQEYLRINTRFEWVTDTFFILLVLGFWFLKGFPFLDRWVRSLNQGPVISGLVFIGVLILIRSILVLPFSIYGTFFIEERFGFNKTTWSTFILDRIKVLFLGALLGGPLLAGILWFFEYAGHHAWWLCWLAVTLYALIAQLVVPMWIMPLFNRFDPLEDGELRQAIMSCAHSIGFPLDNVFVMDGSKRSGKSNAFFTGFGRHKRVVLYDTLVKQQTTAELVSVLAHEMGHYKKKHIIQNLFLGAVEMGVMFFLLSLCISYQGLFDAFYVESRSVYAGLIFFSMLYSPLGFFIGIFFRVFSRKNEYEADRFAVKVTADPESLAMALKKLSVENLSNLMPHPLYVFFHYTHPPVLERINVISNLHNFS